MFSAYPVALMSYFETKNSDLFNTVTDVLSLFILVRRRSAFCKKMFVSLKDMLSNDYLHYLKRKTVLWFFEKSEVVDVLLL